MRFSTYLAEEYYTRNHAVEIFRNPTSKEYADIIKNSYYKSLGLVRFCLDPTTKVLYAWDVSIEHHAVFKDLLRHVNSKKCFNATAKVRGNKLELDYFNTYDDYFSTGIMTKNILRQNWKWASKYFILGHDPEGFINFLKKTRPFLYEEYIGRSDNPVGSYEIFKNPSAKELRSIKDYKNEVRLILRPKNQSIYVFSTECLHMYAMAASNIPINEPIYYGYGAIKGNKIKLDFDYNMWALNVNRKHNLNRFNWKWTIKFLTQDITPIINNLYEEYLFGKEAPAYKTKGQYIEFFRNPNSKELRATAAQSSGRDIRFIIDARKKNVTIWSGDILHDVAIPWLHKEGIFAKAGLGNWSEQELLDYLIGAGHEKNGKVEIEWLNYYARSNTLPHNKFKWAIKYFNNLDIQYLKRQ